MNMIRVLLGTTNEAPYSETAPAEILSTFNAAVLGSLFKVGPGFELQSNLVQSWKWDYRTKTYELTLREGISFHNGRRATATDLEYSLLRGFFSAHRSFYRLYLDSIEGIEAAEGQTVFRPGLISGVQVTGPMTVRVKLRTPNPAFLHSLVDGYFSLVPRESVKDDNITWKDKPVGAGPYRVIEAFKDGHVIVEQVASPHRRITFYTRDSEASYDLALIEPKKHVMSEYQRTLLRLPASVWTIFFSNKNVLGQNEHFRKAVSYLVDQEALSEGLQDCHPAFEMLPRHFWGRAKMNHRHNVAKAREELAHVPDSIKNQPIEVSVFAGASLPAYRAEILRRLEQQFEAVGLRLRIIKTGDKFLSDADAGKYTIKIFGMVTDYVDPLVMFSGFRRGSPYENLRPANDAAFERLYAEVAAIESQGEKTEGVKRVSQLVAESPIAVPLVEENLMIYYQSECVRSLGAQNQPLTLMIENVEFRD